MNAPFRPAPTTLESGYLSLDECRAMAAGRGKNYGAFGAYSDEDLARAIYAQNSPRLNRMLGQ